jgi:hypothetical protein
MIERVARALCKEAVKRGLAKDWTCQLVSDIERIAAEITEREWLKYAADAAAVITALREPSETMIIAMTEVPCDEVTPGGVLFNTGTEAKAIWQSAIDAALVGEG